MTSLQRAHSHDLRRPSEVRLPIEALGLGRRGQLPARDGGARGKAHFPGRDAPKADAIRSHSGVARCYTVSHDICCRVLVSGPESLAFSGTKVDASEPESSQVRLSPKSSLSGLDCSTVGLTAGTDVAAVSADGERGHGNGLALRWLWAPQPQSAFPTCRQLRMTARASLVHRRPQRPVRVQGPNLNLS